MASEFPTCIRASVVVSVPEIENKGRISGKIMNSVSVVLGLRYLETFKWRHFK